jgi:hypothetical protein
LFDTTKENQLDFIAILETKRYDFTLAHFCANKNYTWNWSPTRGCSGGILLGVNIDNFDIQSVALGNFHVKLHLKNKIDNFEWVLVAVYGVAQNEEKTFSYRSLFKMQCGKLTSNGEGDFNIIRSPRAKLPFCNMRMIQFCPWKMI